EAADRSTIAAKPANTLDMLNLPSGRSPAAHPPASLDRHDDATARTPLLRQPERAIAIEQPARIDPQPRGRPADLRGQFGRRGRRGRPPPRTPPERQRPDRRDHNVTHHPPRDPPLRSRITAASSTA